MTTIQRLGGLALFTILAAVALPLHAQDTGPAPAADARYRLALQPDSRLWLKGGSTVRDYECEATTLEGSTSVETADTLLSVEALEDAATSVTLDIPVAALECGNGTMNDHMRKALQAEEHPVIRFRHTAHGIVVGDDGQPRLRIEGVLTMAGEERGIAMDAEAVVETDMTLRVRGSHELDMTDYGVKPPKLMFGTLKVKERVTIHFDMALRP